MEIQEDIAEIQPSEDEYKMGDICVFDSVCVC